MIDIEVEPKTVVDSIVEQTMELDFENELLKLKEENIFLKRKLEWQLYHQKMDEDEKFPRYPTR